MFHFHIPRGRDLWGWPPVVGLLAIIVSLLVFSTIRMMIRQYTIYQQRRAVERRIQALEEEKAALERLLGSTNAPEAIERLAKERLNLKNPGEKVVVVSTDMNATSSRAPVQSSPSWLGRWLAALVQFLRR